MTEIERKLSQLNGTTDDWHEQAVYHFMLDTYSLSNMLGMQNTII